MILINTAIFKYKKEVAYDSYYFLSRKGKHITRNKNYPLELFLINILCFELIKCT